MSDVLKEKLRPGWRKEPPSREEVESGVHSWWWRCTNVPRRTSVTLVRVRTDGVDDEFGPVEYQELVPLFGDNGEFNGRYVEDWQPVTMLGSCDEWAPCLPPDAVATPPAMQPAPNGDKVWTGVTTPDPEVLASVMRGPHYLKFQDPDTVFCSCMGFEWLHFFGNEEAAVAEWAHHVRAANGELKRGKPPTSEGTAPVPQPGEAAPGCQVVLQTFEDAAFRCVLPSDHEGSHNFAGAEPLPEGWDDEAPTPPTSEPGK